MHRNGHIGFALLCYAPVLYLVGRTEPSLLPVALLGAVLLADLLLPFRFLYAAVTSGRRLNASFSPSMLPDLDMRVPGVRHRGITHTVWFALLAAAVFGTVGYRIGGTAGGLLGGDPALLARGGALVSAYLGFHAVVTHLLADMLTPAGVRPFAPLSDAEFSLNLVKAANPLANGLLLAAGVGSVAATLAGFAGLL